MKQNPIAKVEAFIISFFVLFFKLKKTGKTLNWKVNARNTVGSELIISKISPLGHKSEESKSSIKLCENL